MTCVVFADVALRLFPFVAVYLWLIFRPVSVRMPYSKDFFFWALLVAPCWCTHALACAAAMTFVRVSDSGPPLAANLRYLVPLVFGLPGASAAVTARVLRRRVSGGYASLPNHARLELMLVVVSGIVATLLAVFAPGQFSANAYFNDWGGRRTSGALLVPLAYSRAPGHPTDTVGLIYMRARYYDPAIGRFISEDSAKDGGNWYAYAGNDPIGMADPTGKSSVTAGLIGVAGIVGGAQMLAEQVLGYRPGASWDAMAYALEAANLALAAGRFTYASTAALGMTRTANAALSAGLGYSVSIAATGVMATVAMHQVATAMIMDEWDL